MPANPLVDHAITLLGDPTSEYSDLVAAGQLLAQDGEATWATRVNAEAAARATRQLSAIAWPSVASLYAKIVDGSMYAQFMGAGAGGGIGGAADVRQTYYNQAVDSGIIRLQHAGYTHAAVTLGLAAKANGYTGGYIPVA